MDRNSCSNFYGFHKSKIEEKTEDVAATSMMNRKSKQGSSKPGDSRSSSLSYSFIKWMFPYYRQVNKPQYPPRQYNPEDTLPPVQKGRGLFFEDYEGRLRYADEVKAKYAGMRTITGNPYGHEEEDVYDDEETIVASDQW